MLVGLMADTHDCLPLVGAAVKALNQEGVELVLHAGDYVAPFVIPELMKLRAKFIGVYGNNDGDKDLLKKKSGERDRFEIRGTFATVSIDEVQGALLHGSESELLKALIKREAFDLIVFGHTHRIDITQHGKTCAINPGEVCGYISGKSTIVVFDSDAFETEIIEL